LRLQSLLGLRQRRVGVIQLRAASLFNRFRLKLCFLPSFALEIRNLRGLRSELGLRVGARLLGGGGGGLPSGGEFLGELVDLAAQQFLFPDPLELRRGDDSVVLFFRFGGESRVLRGFGDQNRERVLRGFRVGFRGGQRAAELFNLRLQLSCARCERVLFLRRLVACRGDRNELGLRRGQAFRHHAHLYPKRFQG